MCFSAGASFVASGVLTAVGVATLVKVNVSDKEKNFGQGEKLLFAIPFLFAMQQFLEGIVWITTGSGSEICGASTNLLAGYGFLFFALLLWPTLVPWMAYRLERKQKRQQLIAVFAFLGMVVTASLVGFLLGYPLIISTSEHHVLYEVSDALKGDKWLQVFYVLSVVIPGIITSNRFLRYWLLAVLGSYLVAAYFYNSVYVSVWCFFSAILSLAIYGYVGTRD